MSSTCDTQCDIENENSWRKKWEMTENRERKNKQIAESWNASGAKVK
jgi:hypothetical protein